jgi:site-specific recombinase XerD
MDNRAAVCDFVSWMRLKREAPATTLDTYRRTCEAWADFLLSDLADRTPDDVEAFTARPRRRGVTDAKAATIAREVATLGSLYRYGQARHGWPSNPALLAGRPKVHNRQPRPVDDATWLQVWTADLPTDARVALGLGYYCGLRRREITSLHGGQVWGGALVNFTRKGGGEDRFDYADVLGHWQAMAPHLQAERLTAPLEHLARRRGDLALMPWGDWTSPKALNRRMYGWLSDCGLPSAAFTPHSLRHSFATNLLRTGVPLDVACDLCNHSSPAITMLYIKTGGGRLAALRQPAMEAAV